jgi:hypothetical protein
MICQTAQGQQVCHVLAAAIVIDQLTKPASEDRPCSHEVLLSPVVHLYWGTGQEDKTQTASVLVRTQPCRGLSAMPRHLVVNCKQRWRAQIVNQMIHMELGL